MQVIGGAAGRDGIARTRPGGMRADAVKSLLVHGYARLAFGISPGDPLIGWSSIEPLTPFDVRRRMLGIALHDDDARLRRSGSEPAEHSRLLVESGAVGGHVDVDDWPTGHPDVAVMADGAASWEPPRRLRRSVGVDAVIGVQGMGEPLLVLDTVLENGHEPAVVARGWDGVDGYVGLLDRSGADCYPDDRARRMGWACQTAGIAVGRTDADDDERYGVLAAEMDLSRYVTRVTRMLDDEERVVLAGPKDNPDGWERLPNATMEFIRRVARMPVPDYGDGPVGEPLNVDTGLPHGYRVVEGFTAEKLPTLISGVEDDRMMDVLLRALVGPRRPFDNRQCTHISMGMCHAPTLRQQGLGLHGTSPGADAGRTTDWFTGILRQVIGVGAPTTRRGHQTLVLAADLCFDALDAYYLSACAPEAGGQPADVTDDTPEAREARRYRMTHDGMPLMRRAVGDMLDACRAIIRDDAHAPMELVREDLIDAAAGYREWAMEASELQARADAKDFVFSCFGHGTRESIRGNPFLSPLAQEEYSIRVYRRPDMD